MVCVRLLPKARNTQASPHWLQPELGILLVLFCDVAYFLHKAEFQKLVSIFCLWLTGSNMGRLQRYMRLLLPHRVKAAFASSCTSLSLIHI